MAAAHHQVSKLAVKEQGAPHGAHVKSIPGWDVLDSTLGLPTTQLGGTQSHESSIISFDDHSQYTTTELMQ